MKVKLKLNGAAIKALAIQHGEKAGLALGVGACVLFIWSAAKMDVLGPEKQPTKLEEAAKKTDDHIRDSKWDPVAKGIEVVDYVQRAKRDPLADKDYRLVHPFNPPIWESKGKRPDPKMFPVEEMLASAGLGVFALSKEIVEPDPAGPKKPANKKGTPGPKGMSEPKGGPLAGAKDKKGGPPGGPGGPPRGPKQNPPDMVVHGIRPGRDSELKGFSWVVITGLIPIAKQEAEFEEAFRNVIKPIPEADEPQYRGYKIERAEIAGDAEPVWQEIKVKEYNQQFRARWQAESHEIIDETYSHRGYTMPLAPLVSADWDPAVVGHPKVPLAEKAGAAAAARPAPSDAADDEDDEFGLSGPNPPGKAGAPPPMTQRKKGPGKTGPQRRLADVVLFRFIDSTVQPGKQYRYHVKLALTNPNYGVTDRYLRNPASRTQKTVYSPWSEPTPLVTVPRDIEIFAGPVVKPSSSAMREPMMKAMVTKLDREHGLKLTAEETFQRGSLVNIRKKIESEAPVPGDSPIVVDALLNSDSVVVDIEGGKPLKGPKSPTMPGEMVILQPDGSLVLRDEFDDESTYRTNFPDEGVKQTADKPDAQTAPKEKGSKLEALKAEAKKKKKHKKSA